jgi:hypothetical protein
VPSIVMASAVQDREGLFLQRMAVRQGTDAVGRVVVVELQQLTACVLARLPEFEPVEGDLVVDDGAGLCHGDLLGSWDGTGLHRAGFEASTLCLM